MKLLYATTDTLHPPHGNVLNPFNWLKNNGTAEIEQFQFDQNFAYQGQRFDHFLLEKYEAVPDMLYICCQGNPFAFRDNEVLEKLVAKGWRFTFIWYDAVNRGVSAFIESYGNLMEKAIIIDDPFYKYRSQFPDKIVNLWSPFEIGPEPIYENREVDLVFVGNVKAYDERRRYGELISEMNLNAFYGGGIGDNHLFSGLKDDYLRQSKVGLNFSRAFLDRSHQLKGRVMEVLHAGALLMETRNDYTSTLFDPMVDYVPWDGEKDFAEKLRYYLSHENERIEIAKRGSQKARQHYNMEKYWDKVLALI